MNGTYGGAQRRSRKAGGTGRRTRSHGRTPPTPDVPGTSAAVPNHDDGISPGQNQSGGTGVFNTAFYRWKRIRFSMSPTTILI